MNFYCDSSAGITRIRYAGQALMALLSARQHRAPRAIQLHFEYNGRYMLLSSQDLPGDLNIAMDLSD